MLGAGIGLACFGYSYMTDGRAQAQKMARNSQQRATLNWPTDRALASPLGVRSCSRRTARCEWTHPQRAGVEYAITDTILGRSNTDILTLRLRTS
jgi:hypothetical protein